MLELDQVVRDNQLARCPFAKSGRADLLLHERYPVLVEDIEEERQIRVKAMAYKITSREDDKKLSSSFKTKFGSLDDFALVSPSFEKNRRKSKSGRNEPFSPDLRPKNSKVDLIFDMEEEESCLGSPSPSMRPVGPPLQDELDSIPSLGEAWTSVKGKGVSSSPMPAASSPAANFTPSTTPARSSEMQQASNVASPWASAVTPAMRLDLKDIMAESKPAHSALTAGLAAQKSQAAKSAPQKMTQKERKKYLQQQADELAQQEAIAASRSQAAWTQVGEKKNSPWQCPPAGPKMPANKATNPDSKATLEPPVSKHIVTAESSAMSIPRRAASPDTRFSGQSRSGSATPRVNSNRAHGGISPAKLAQGQPSSIQSGRPDPKPLVPHSKSYIQKPQKQSDSVIGLGLADIIGQQQREQQSVKEAVAKRNLEEIQQEQAFQEWWDAESRRIQEEEARRQNRDKSRDDKKPNGGRRGRGGKPRNGSNKDNEGAAASVAEANSGGPTFRGRGKGPRGGRTATQKTS
jgi:inhibitor of Bruton tyrosine kinase